jgi:hypothetical protein
MSENDGRPRTLEDIRAVVSAEAERLLTAEDMEGVQEDQGKMTLRIAASNILHGLEIEDRITIVNEGLEPMIASGQLDPHIRDNVHAALLTISLAILFN